MPRRRRIFATNTKIRTVWISEVSTVVHVSGGYPTGRASLHSHGVAVSDVAPLVLRRGTTSRRIQPLFTGFFNGFWLRFCFLVWQGLKASFRGGWTRRSADQLYQSLPRGFSRCRNEGVDFQTLVRAKWYSLWTWLRVWPRILGQDLHEGSPAMSILGSPSRIEHQRAAEQVAPEQPPGLP